MPMHDWTRVHPADYFDFRFTWLAALATTLNMHRMPPEFYALIDHTPPPAARWRIAVQRARDRQPVAVIEFVSPGNKAKKAGFADLVGKSAQLLRQGVHVLLMDPLPPTARDPHGLHAAVWKELTGKAFVPPAGKPLTLAAYRAAGGDTYTAYVEPVAVGDVLPDMPVFRSRPVK